jgi:hypothetical protein
MRRVIVIAIGFGSLLMITGCATTAISQVDQRAATVTVNGTIPRACPGPVRVRPGNCLATMTIHGSGVDRTVASRYQLRLIPGIYHVQLDLYCDGSVTVKHGQHTLPLAHLLSRCAIPL